MHLRRAPARVTVIWPRYAQHDAGVRTRRRISNPPAISPRRSPQLIDGIERGDRFQTLLGITGSGKTFTIANVIAEGAAPHARAGAQQVARRAAGDRVPRVLPEEPGRVLRLLLRLLPARGVHPVDRHLHREGQLDQRRDRPAAPLGHVVAADPARRDHRGVGVGASTASVHPRSTGATARSSRSARSTTACDPAPPRRPAVRAQRLRLRPQQVPGARRHDRDLPGLRGDARCAFELFGDEVERICSVDPLTGEIAEETRPARAVPGVALRHRRRAPREGIVRDRGRAARAARRGSRPRASCSRRSACGCAPPTTSRCCARSGSARASRTTRRHLDGRARGRAALHAARLLPRRLLVVSTSRTSPCRSCTGSTRATGRARRRSSGTASGSRPRWTTGRCGSTSSSSRSTRSCSCRPRPGRTSWRSRRQVVEQIVRPTGLVDPEVDRAADQGPDRRPDRRDQRAGRGATSACSSRRSRRRCRKTSPTICSSSASACATCTPRSTRSSASRSCATCASASSTCSSASTSCVRGSTCRRSRWSRSSTPTRKGSCARRPR